MLFFAKCAHEHLCQCLTSALLHRKATHRRNDSRKRNQDNVIIFTMLASHTPSFSSHSTGHAVLILQIFFHTSRQMASIPSSGSSVDHTGQVDLVSFAMQRPLVGDSFFLSSPESTSARLAGPRLTAIVFVSVTDAGEVEMLDHARETAKYL